MWRLINFIQGLYNRFIVRGTWVTILVKDDVFWVDDHGRVIGRCEYRIDYNLHRHKVRLRLAGVDPKKHKCYRNVIRPALEYAELLLTVYDREAWQAVMLKWLAARFQADLPAGASPIASIPHSMSVPQLREEIDNALARRDFARVRELQLILDKKLEE